MVSTASVNCLTARSRNIAASCVLMLFAGAMYAVGVFDPPISASEPALAGVWASSMATMTLISAPAMIVAALYLSDSEGDGESQKSRKLGQLASLGGLCFLGLSTGAVGIKHTSKSLIRLAVTAQGIPFGICKLRAVLLFKRLRCHRDGRSQTNGVYVMNAFFKIKVYVVGIELLAAWMPDRPGLGIGFGQMAFGVGTIAFSGIFEKLTKTFGSVGAIHVSALALAITTWLTVPLLQWPRSSECPSPSSSQAGVAATSFTGVKISTRSLPFLREFWLYMGAVFAAQMGFAFVPYYFEMSADFGVPQLRAVLLFQLTNGVATMARLCAGVLADRCGSRRLMIALLGTQVGLFALLAAAARANVFAAFASAVLGELVVFSSVASAAAVLARDLFGTMNSAVVFGVGAGITMGLGEAVAAALIGVLASGAPRDAGPARFNSYFALAAIASAAGALCAWAAAPCPAAIPPPSLAICDEEIGLEWKMGVGDAVKQRLLDGCCSERNGSTQCGLQTHEILPDPYLFPRDYGSVDSFIVAEHS